MLPGDKFTHLLDYWKQHLSGHEALLLPTDYPRPVAIDYSGKDYHFDFDAQ
jgi:hypothetical protein